MFCQIMTFLIVLLNGELQCAVSVSTFGLASQYFRTIL